MIKVFALVKEIIYECELEGLTAQYASIKLLDGQRWRVPKEHVDTNEEVIKNLQSGLYSNRIQAAASGLIREGNVIKVSFKSRGRTIESDFKIIKVNKTRCVCEDLSTHKHWNVYKDTLNNGKLVHRA